MKFILFPPYLNPSSSQDVLHGDAIEVSKILVELTVREESLSKGVDCGLLVAKWNVDFLSVEAPA